MTTTLITQLSADGVRLFDPDTNEHVFTIVAKAELGMGVRYRLTVHGDPWGGDDAEWWNTLEAAQYYALACYANDQSA